VGFHIDQDPAPLLVIQPTLEMAEAWSKDRLAPMLRDTPVLRGKVKDPRSRDADNTLLHKVFAGGHITMVGANSPASLAMRPIRIVLADEVDRYPVSAGTEGDPLKLAAKRQITFWNRKTLLGSTPTLKGLSVIEREWARSDQRRFFVPCPECRHEQVLRWEQVRWDKEKNQSGETVAHRPETAHYACEACGSLWSDAARFQAVSRGAWRATAPFSGIAGFTSPPLSAPGSSWPTWFASSWRLKTGPSSCRCSSTRCWARPSRSRASGSRPAR
jgi:phage terminase large subunit GpA-like protein